MIPSQYRSSICSLDIDQHRTGTAFAIDEEHVVTAAHNVIDSQSETRKAGSISVRVAEKAMSVEWEDTDIDRVNDVAVLRVLRHRFAEWLPIIGTGMVPDLGDSVDKPIRWSAWGYPQAINPGGFGLSGTVTAMDVPLPEGKCVIQLDVDQYESAKMGGMSGAPIIVGENCIGVVVKYPLNLTNGTLFAASLEMASGVLPVLAKCLERDARTLPEQDRALKAYLDATRRRDVLSEFVMRSSVSSRGANRSFVTLRATLSRSLESVEPIPLDQLLGTGSLGEKKPSSLWIQGPPGSGKTTFLRHLARSAWVEPSKIGLLERALPLYARLARLAAAQDVFLGRRLLLAMDSQDGTVSSEKIPENFLERWPKIARAKWLLLFDGMDEVPIDRRDEMFQVIRFVMDQGHMVVITSRPDVNVPEELEKRFARFSLQPASPEEQEAIATSLLGELAPQFQAAIAERNYPWLRGNPLLISFAALVFQKGEALPRRRIDLYERVMDDWLSRAKPRLLDPDMPHDMVDLAKPVLECIALQMSVEPLKIRVAELLPAVAPVMAKFSGRPEALFQRLEVGGRFLKALGRYTGFFEVLGDTCAWLHPTFREYFAAQQLGQMPSGEHTTTLFAKVSDPSWQQILLMLITIWSDRQNVDGYFQQIARISPDGPLLAAQALFEGAQVSDPVAAESLEGLVDAVADDAEVSVCASLLSAGHEKREARLQAVTFLSERSWFSNLREKLIEDLERRCRKAENLSGDTGWEPQWFKYLKDLEASEAFENLATDEALPPVVRAIAANYLAALEPARASKRLESIAVSVRESSAAAIICSQTAAQLGRFDLGKQVLTGINLTWDEARRLARTLSDDHGQELLQILDPELVHPRVFLSLVWQYVENSKEVPVAAWTLLQRSVAKCDERNEVLQYPSPGPKARIINQLVLSKTVRECEGLSTLLIRYSAHEGVLVDLCHMLAQGTPATEWPRWIERKDIPQGAVLVFVDGLLSKLPADDPSFKEIGTMCEAAGVLVPNAPEVTGLCYFLKARFLINLGERSEKTKENLKRAAGAATVFRVGSAVVVLDVQSIATRFLAELQWTDGERDECIGTLSSYLEKAPADLLVRNQRGRAQYDLGRYADSVADFEWTLQNRYRVASIAECAEQMRLAAGALRAQDLGLAGDEGYIAEYTNALAERLRYEAATIAGYADALRHLGRYKDAADLASVVADDASWSFLALQVRGACRLVLDPRQAMDDLTQAIELCSPPTFPRLRRSYLYRMLGDLDSATKDVGDVLAEEPSNLEALGLLGELLMMRGRSSDLTQRLFAFREAGVREDILRFVEVCAKPEWEDADLGSFEAQVRHCYGEGLAQPSKLTDEALAHLVLYSLILSLGVDPKQLIAVTLDRGRLDALVERVLPLCRYFGSRRAALRTAADQVIQEIAAAIRSRGGVTEWMEAPRGTKDLTTDARQLLSVFPAKQYPFPMYCQKAYIGDLQAQHHACEVLLKTLLPTQDRLILLVRLDEDSRVYGECSFKKEPIDEFRFKFCDELSTLLHQNLTILVHDFQVNRFVFLEESLKARVNQELVHQALPATTQLI